MADTQLRIGIIGTGMRSVIAKHWQQPDKRSVVVAAADVDAKRLDEFRAKTNPDAFVTTDYRKLLDRKDVDAVAVTTPDWCHEEHAIAALQAGKHVFCEKPLAITVDGCDNILRAWRQSGKHLMVGFNLRYNNLYRTMKEIAESGILGRIRLAWARYFVGPGGNWYFHDWHALQKNGTTLLLQKASHDFDIIHWITGRYARRVCAFGGLDYFGGDMPNDLTCPTCDRRRTCPEVQPPDTPRQQCCFRREVDMDDNAMVIMEMGDGVRASYQQCHFAPDGFRSYAFIGELGRMENFNGPQGEEVRVYTRHSGTARDCSWRTYHVRSPQGGHGGADPVITEDFLDMVLEGKEPVATPLAGRMSVAVGCAGAESMRNGGIPRDVPELPADLR